ncbi:Uncharacterised protein [Corynebacterium kutscheri]|uniref:Uncharacterized protein n=1 Tax=Corynebacterium kutscheri TaxID=35755 RepID=A0A0F6R367_9CORY|nr:hypothetical protein [Corynebacterium kutscheri]AKE42073.1 hypothetical protein UL82_09680 [Corynebacterium kutscheri]VEH06041.1 Uncharacterised protein [Corynebacterium kutscheri]VEH10415.1 Uncharacterised protein [Corynebacterium kutscheri]VEH81947.1 Uncharacterised protein [Corynebacterium kutscheri]
MKLHDAGRCGALSEERAAIFDIGSLVDEREELRLPLFGSEAVFTDMVARNEQVAFKQDDYTTETVEGIA